MVTRSASHGRLRINGHSPAPLGDLQPNGLGSMVSSNRQEPGDSVPFQGDEQWLDFASWLVRYLDGVERTCIERENWSMLEMERYTTTAKSSGVAVTVTNFNTNSRPSSMPQAVPLCIVS